MITIMIKLARNCAAGSRLSLYINMVSDVKSAADHSSFVHCWKRLIAILEVQLMATIEAEAKND